MKTLKNLHYLVVLSAILMPEASYAQGTGILKANTLACKNYVDAQDLLKFIRANDIDAFVKKALIKSQSQECFELKKGMQFFLHVEANEITCIREKGSIDCLWVPNTHLDTD